MRAKKFLSAILAIVMCSSIFLTASGISEVGTLSGLSEIPQGNTNIVFSYPMSESVEGDTIVSFTGKATGNNGIQVVSVLPNRIASVNSFTIATGDYAITLKTPSSSVTARIFCKIPSDAAVGTVFTLTVDNISVTNDKGVTTNLGPLTKTLTVKEAPPSSSSSSSSSTSSTKTDTSIGNQTNTTVNNTTAWTGFNWGVKKTPVYPTSPTTNPASLPSINKDNPAILSMLKVNDGKILLNPAFDPTIAVYVVDIPKTINRLDITAIPKDKNVSVEIVGADNLINAKENTIFINLKTASGQVLTYEVIARYSDDMVAYKTNLELPAWMIILLVLFGLGILALILLLTYKRIKSNKINASVNPKENDRIIESLGSSAAATAENNPYKSGLSQIAVGRNPMEEFSSYDEKKDYYPPYAPANEVILESSETDEFLQEKEVPKQEVLPQEEVPQSLSSDDFTDDMLSTAAVASVIPDVTESSEHEKVYETPQFEQTQPEEENINIPSNEEKSDVEHETSEINQHPTTEDKEPENPISSEPETESEVTKVPEQKAETASQITNREDYTFGGLPYQAAPASEDTRTPFEDRTPLSGLNESDNSNTPATNESPNDNMKDAENPGVNDDANLKYKKKNPFEESADD